MSVTGRRAEGSKELQAYSQSENKRVWDNANPPAGSIARDNLFDFSPPPGQRWEVYAIDAVFNIWPRNDSEDFENFPHAHYALSYADQFVDDVTDSDLNGNTIFHDSYEHLIYGAGRVHQTGSNATTGNAVNGHPLFHHVREWRPFNGQPLELKDTEDLNVLMATSYPATTTHSGGEETVFGEASVTVHYEPFSE